MLLGKLTVPNGAGTHRRNNDDDSGDNRNIRTSLTHEHRLVPVSCVHVGVCMYVCMHVCGVLFDTRDSRRFRVGFVH